MMRIVLVVALLLTFASAAHATGPTVGSNCTASWTTVAPVGGGTITYNWYVSATATPGAPAVTGLTATTLQPCLVLVPGQYTGWVSAVETLAGSASESALSVPFSFVLIRPGTPTLTVR